MSEEQGLTTALQESIIAVLVYDDKWGATIAALVKAEHFDEPNNEIAAKVLDYRARYHKPPGDVHLADLFGAALERGARPTRIRRLLHDIATLRKDLNGEYVSNQVTAFVRRQTLKSALLTASQRYEQGGPELLEDVEKILYQALTTRTAGLDPGTFLDEAKALRFLDKRDYSQLTPLGIKQFDDLGLGLVAKDLLLFVGPKGTGKTWFCVYCGRQVLQHGGKFLHITLEVREEIIAGRYFQNIFGMGAKPDDYLLAALELGDKGEFLGLDERATRRKRKPDVDFTNPKIRSIIEKRRRAYGTRIGRVLVKEFPNGTLSSTGLEAYLDYLDKNHRFVPTAIAVDYPDLMKFDRREYRFGLRSAFEDLRRIAGERNLAMIAPTQSTRGGMKARQVRSSHVSEDISKVQTADIVLTLSATREERNFGLARLHLEHSRTTKDDVTLLITQSYPTGQFCLKSYKANSAYYDVLRALSGQDAVAEATDDTD